MDFDNLINLELKMSTVLRAPNEEEQKLLDRYFTHTGSRSVIPGDVGPDTDYDYIGGASEDAKLVAEELGFFPKNITEDYMDDTTDSVWYNPSYNAQIVFKKPEYYSACIEMWQCFRDNPNLFRDYFWKSNPARTISKADVRDRINMFVRMFK